MGFCEYGIKDFCEKLNLDIDKTYLVSELKERLTVEVFLDYPSECKKLFQKIPFTNIELLEFGEHNSKHSRSSLKYTIRKGIISDRILSLFSCEVALSCLQNFENVYLNDKRPRLAIEARLAHLEDLISDEELSAAYYAAYSAANSTFCTMLKDAITDKYEIYEMFLKISKEN